MNDALHQQRCVTTHCSTNTTSTQGGTSTMTSPTQRSTSRRALALLVALCLALFVAACGGDDDDDDTADAGDSSNTTAEGDGGGEASDLGTVTLGASLCLSGPGAQNGETMKQGLDLGVERLNEEFADQGVTFEVKYEDSAADPEKGVTAFNKLAGEGVPLMVQCGSSVTVAAVPLAEEENVVLLNASASSPRLIGLSDNLFNSYLNSSQQIDAQVELLSEDGRKDVCLYVVNDDYGNGALDVLKTALPDAGINIACTEFHVATDTDHRAQISKMKDANPDAIVALSYGAPMVSFVQQLDSQGVDAQLYSWDGIETKDLLEVAGDSAEGIIFTAPFYDLESTDERTAEYVERYHAEYGEDATPAFFSTSYYEASLIWGDVVQYLIDNGLDYDADSIREALSESDGFDAIGGDTITFEDGNTARRTLGVKTVENGAYVFVKTLD